MLTLLIALSDGGGPETGGWRINTQHRDFGLDAFTLSNDERARCDAMTAVEAAQLRRAAHTCKREVTGAHLGVPPALVPFASESGAPRLLPPYQATHVTLSHTVGAVAVAVSSASVGVDVEQIERTDGVQRLASRYYAADEALLVARSDDPQFEFTWRWTAKEALLKASGLSLSCALATSLGDTPRALTDMPFTMRARNAHLMSFAPAPGYVCSVARL